MWFIKATKFWNFASKHYFFLKHENYTTELPYILFLFLCSCKSEDFEIWFYSQTLWECRVSSAFSPHFHFSLIFILKNICIFQPVSDSPCVCLPYDISSVPRTDQFPFLHFKLDTVKNQVSMCSKPSKSIVSQIIIFPVLLTSWMK